MATSDVSRYLDPASSHYVGSRLQQSRAIIDPDINEGQQASDADVRASRADIASASASPDGGFLPALQVGSEVYAKEVTFGRVISARVLDYEIQAGSMHIGGQRYSLVSAESVLFQKSYLQMGSLTAPRAVVGVQRQLSYLRATEQSVSATEDSELMEAALHGADTSQRLRKTARMEVRNVSAENCHDAFSEILEEMGNLEEFTYDSASAELRSNARLQMRFTGDPAGDCAACDPALRGRYLGSEDHAIRLMLASSTSFVWSYDNASPLYRVKLVFDGTGATVTMLTPPKDLHHEPGINRVIEFLPWSVLLENGESPPSSGGFTNQFLATKVGFFAEIDSAYNRSSREFHATIDPSSLEALTLVPEAGGAKKGPAAKPKAEAKAAANEAGVDVIALEWDSQHPHAAELNPSDVDAEELIGFVYMRVWHTKQTDESLTIPFNSEKPLERTGLVPVFTGVGRPGDYWVATVRSSRRDSILPSGIMQAGGIPPVGPVEKLVPIALVQWRSITGDLHTVTAIEDCRPTLPAITQRDCCRYSVGMAEHAADFTSIQEAIDSLPRSGGEVCVHPGVYREQLALAGRKQITLTGCGSDCVLASPDAPSAKALLDIVSDDNTTGMVIRNMAISADGQVAISCRGPRITLSNLNLSTGPSATATSRSAVEAISVSRFFMKSCSVVLDRSYSDFAGIFIHALNGAVLDGNSIAAATNDAIALAWGGIQIAGGSKKVSIRNNDIADARGHGISIGSVGFRAVNGDRLAIVGAGLGQSAEGTPFALNGIIAPVEVGNVDNTFTRYYPEPGPAIEDLLIADNRIQNCRGSAIAALAPSVEHDDVARSAPLCYRRTRFTTNEIVIRHNKLLDNAVGISGTRSEYRTRGGIVLSEVAGATVMNNVIESNGIEADAGPVCGIHIPVGSDIVVAGNSLSDNGFDGNTTLDSQFLGGGIVLAETVSGFDMDIFRNAPTITDVRLYDNSVQSRDSAALVIVCGGNCSINANRFESAYRSIASDNGDAGTVRVMHAGRCAESVDLPLNEPDDNRWNQPQGSRDFLTGPAQNHVGVGGMSFSNNQIRSHRAVSGNSLLPIPVFIASSDSLIMTGNQLSATAPRNSHMAHCWVTATTCVVAHNRIAEGIETMGISLVAVSSLLGTVENNLLTHCPVVFGCDNDNDNRFFISEDNLHWFRLQSLRCEQLKERLVPFLRVFCAALLGGESTGDFSADTENPLIAAGVFRSTDT